MPRLRQPLQTHKNRKRKTKQSAPIRKQTNDIDWPIGEPPSIRQSKAGRRSSETLDREGGRDGRNSKEETTPLSNEQRGHEEEEASG